MKTIVIHHVQSIWNNSLIKYGTSFEEVIENVYNHLLDNYYDDVIITNFEAGFYLDDDQLLLDQFCPAVYDYGYGWDEEALNYADWNYIPGGNHSEVVPIDDWMKTLKGEVYLCGAFDGECIEDMEIALSSLDNIILNRIESLII